MRLTETEVIVGLMHPEMCVRDALLNYFKGRLTPPLELTHAMIEVIDLRGWDDAFRWSHKICDCLHDDSSLNWCLEEIEKIQKGVSTANLSNSTLPSQLISWATKAPVELLKSHRQRLANTSAFLQPILFDSETPLEKIDRRIEIASLDSQQAWQRITEYCISISDVTTFAEANIHCAEELLTPIVADGENCHERMLELLSDPDADHQGANGWMVGLMINLAGRMQLEESLPLLLSKYAVDWDYYNEEVSHAIKAIGTPTAHKAVAEYYPGKPWYVRNYLCGVLEDIHVEGAAETIFPLLADESEDDLRVQLAAAMSAQLDDFALKPAYEVYKENPRDPERSVIVENLYALTVVGNIYSSQNKEWGQKIADHANGNDKVNRFESIPRFDSAVFEPENTSTLTVVKKQGRNEPCNCGSGKKYKKCCLRANSPFGS